MELKKEIDDLLSKLADVRLSIVCICDEHRSEVNQMLKNYYFDTDITDLYDNIVNTEMCFEYISGTLEEGENNANR